MYFETSDPIFGKGVIQDVYTITEKAKSLLTSLNDKQPCPANYRAIEGLSYALKWMNYRKTYIENNAEEETVED